MAKIKELKANEIEEITADLLHAKSEKRRAAAKKIGKLLIHDAVDTLFEAYVNEKKDERTWETQVEMIKSLGRLRCKKLLPHVKKIIEQNLEFDRITNVSATAFVRLESNDNSYIPTVIELFKIGKHSVLSGAIAAVLFDGIIPEQNEMIKLIETVNNSYHPDERGIEDTRKKMACIMSVWPKNIVKPYLESYKNIPQVPIHVVEEALKGKPYCAGEY